MLIEYVDLDCNLDSFENYSSMCRRLLTKIIFTQNKFESSNICFDRVYVPHTILNILSSLHNEFSTYGIVDEGKSVGKLNGRIDVYVDFSMKRNQILFSFDKNVIRENKLETLLEGDVDYNLQEVILEIKSEFLI